MKASLRKLKKSRRYSVEFKKEMVNLFESGKFSVRELEKLYGVGNPAIYRWIHKYSTVNEKGVRIVEMKDSTTKKLKELANKVKQLEQIVGQKQIQIDVLETMIDIANQEFDIDIKKKYSTSQSSDCDHNLKR